MYVCVCIYIHIYIGMYVCVCVSIYIYIYKLTKNQEQYKNVSRTFGKFSRKSGQLKAYFLKIPQTLFFVLNFC